MPVRIIALAIALGATSLMGDVAWAGNLFVAQASDENSFTRIDMLGGTTTFPAGETVTGLAIDAAGIVYLMLPNADKIEKFSMDGVDLGLFATIDGADGGQYVAFDSTGNLYVSNHSNNTIRRFSPSGVDLGVFASTGLSTPQGLRFDSQGNLYVANGSGNTVRKFSPTGVDLGDFASAGLNSPTDVDFDSQGNLYVSNYVGNTISKFSSSGADLGIFAATGLLNPNGIAFDSTGNLFVSNNLALGGTIRQFSPTGVDLGDFASVDSPAQIVFSASAALVPEPGALTLVGIALGSVLIASRWRRRTSVARAPPTRE